MRRKKASSRRSHPKTNYRRFINRNIMAAGGLSRKHGPYALLHGRAANIGIKVSAGMRGVEVGTTVGVGRRRRIGIDYNITTNSPTMKFSPNLKASLKAFLR